MAAAFVQTVDGVALPPGSLQEYTSRNSFPEIYSSSFPVFALASQVSESDLRQATDTINEQAWMELSFDDAELVEMGYAAALRPTRVRWYHEELNKGGTSGTDDPQWYPLKFLDIASPDWKNTGAVLVFYAALHEQSNNENVTVKAHRVDPEKIGPTLISLR
ncbi:uncharacterized protein K460DRAFT_386137 [Cucurbitaria berberidis CBS 394.84]|uniref:Uncharacterized protein n=1 Tax=Cucurbitaria berberidis CBS 394.84 TaxID=1168544 RepID=A0A9P4GHU8_9PLEO|nr:uncharacterized protein K460DRAFT_386137 [Cucurbitaria berberidis CBS 394.84]KAF1845701.1 hypothetical protein K460DRAFT_386137 [Cucurbitaria berberidis CBS 394.84]